MFRALQTQAGHNRATYWIAQVLFTGPVLTPVWVTGAVWSLRSQAARPFRPAGIACVIVIVPQFVLGGKPYYPGGAYTFLFAAGCVPLERWLAARKAQASRFSPAARMGAAMLVGAVIAAPMTLSVLPARALHTVPLQKINYDLGEEIAWPKLVALVAREYHALPAAQRARTTILTGNYGEAGAIDRYGPGFGLPQVYSGAQQLLALGPAARRRLRRHRGKHRPGVPAPRVRPRPPRRHVLERDGRQRRRAGRAGVPRHRPEVLLVPVLAGLPQLFLTRPVPNLRTRSARP